MLVLSSRPGKKVVGDDGVTVEEEKYRPEKEWLLKTRVTHRMDHRQRDDRLCFAAMKALESSGYSALRRLKCEVTEAVIAVHGAVPSYYLKQMAQSAIQRLEGIRGVTNLVQVHAAHPV
jgi:hypothetical protein